jgi:hypothetical protein
MAGVISQVAGDLDFWFGSPTGGCLFQTVSLEGFTPFYGAKFVLKICTMDCILQN